jgi:pimeloyl-ACP methyl ester carboxylesterase
MANTYVLVHGSWHGGWGWTAVAKHLAAQGHKVYTPTLAGHGPDVERVGVTHQDCVDSLVQYIERRDLRDVILVGHSWGGNMLCGAAPRIADRIQRLIFWSAFVLNDGESTVDVMPPHYVALFKQLADSSSDYTVSLPWEVWRSVFMQDSEEETARLIYSLLSPEPMRVYEARLDQKAFFNLSIPKSYLLTRDDIAMPPGEYAWYPRFGNLLGAHKYVEAPGSHEACFTHPIELANAIVEASVDVLLTTPS